MSRYRGPRFKKIRRLGSKPGLTSKSPTDKSELRNQTRSSKKSQYRIRLEEKQKSIGRSLWNFYFLIELTNNQSETKA